MGVTHVFEARLEADEVQGDDVFEIVDVSARVTHIVGRSVWSPQCRLGIFHWQARLGRLHTGADTARRAWDRGPGFAWSKAKQSMRAWARGFTAHWQAGTCDAPLLPPAPPPPSSSLTWLGPRRTRPPRGSCRTHPTLRDTWMGEGLRARMLRVQRRRRQRQVTMLCRSWSYYLG